jgi:arsenite methyltransferase
MDAIDTYSTVQTRYGDYAKNSDGGDFNVTNAQKVAAAFGYSLQELSSLPDNANLGVSCGNPLATANVKEVSCM